MSELPEVIYAGIIESAYLQGIEHTWCAGPTDHLSRYIHDEIIGWEVLRREHLGNLFDGWGYLYSTHQLIYDIYSKKLPDNSIFRVWVTWHALEIECERQGRLRFQPRSINDLKAILRSIDPVLVGE